MKTALETRLKELKEEYQKGQKQMLALNQEIADLGNTMLRISGAIQVLEELLGDKPPANSLPSSNGFEVSEHPQKSS